MPVEVDVPVVVPVCTAPWLAQKLVNQPWTLLRASGVAAHAPTQGPPVTLEKAARRASLQKQESYVPASAVAAAGGTQAPFTS